LKIETLHNHFLSSSGVCTDTRKITQNCLFFALKGETFNGNTFAAEAIKQRAQLAIVDDADYYTANSNTVLVKNTLKSLQALAQFHRKYLDIPIIAITGSNGKTTTKELINAVLSQKFKTSATVGNLNNHIGVPLTLLSMTTETELGIVEMGANHLKEIEQLAALANPDYGYITNFGKAHLEGFGSLDGVIKGKSELYDYLRVNNKTAFINGDDATQLKQAAGIKSYRFGTTGKQDCKIQLEDASDKVTVSLDGLTIKSNLVGLYNFHNISAAIAMGVYFEVASEKTKNAIETYVPSNNRSQLIEKNGHHIILDAYNANPTSMMAALKNIEQAAGTPKILFLGDMFELGNTAQEEHEAIVTYLKEHPFGTAYLIGSNFNATHSTDSHIVKFENFESFQEKFKDAKLTPSTILIKASRGMALERILDLL